METVDICEQILETIKLLEAAAKHICLLNNNDDFYYTLYDLNKLISSLRKDYELNKVKQEN